MKSARWSLLGLLLSVAACTTTGVKSQYYSLYATQASPAGLEAVAAEPMGIGPVQLPGQLQRKQILSYSAGQEVKLASHAFWAENLDTLISRVLAQDISVLLGNPYVLSYPWGVQARPSTRVAITILELGGPLGGDISLEARWQVTGARGEERLPESARLSKRAQDASYESYTRTINELLSELAKEVAATLERSAR